MSAKFAEKIIDGMVDGNGYCGERGLSEKQFDCIARYLESEDSEWVNAWYGNKYGGKVDFYSTDYVGTIGKYQVVLNELWHFHRRCTVVEINLRPAEEIEAENKREQEESERKAAYKAMCESSQWVGTPKKRDTFELTLLKDYNYERAAYNYGTEIAHIYTLADNDGNLFVWKTTNIMGVWVPDDDDNETASWVYAEIGDKVTMKATVKEHSEYKGAKQTVLTRCKVIGIDKH